MKTLSTYFIVKNEEKSIRDCIESVLCFSDEIIVVDTGSNDKTKDVVESFENSKIKIYDFEWCDNFSKARNFSLSKTSCDYVLTMDADEIATKELQEEILELKRKDFMGFTRISIPGFFSKNNSEEYNFTRHIISKDSEPYWIYPVHEELKCKKDLKTTFVSKGKVINNKFGDSIKTNFNKYCEMYYNEFNSKINYDTDGFFYYYIQFTIFTNDVPLVKTMLSNVFKEKIIKNGPDIRFLCGNEKRFSKDEFMVLYLINSESTLNDKNIIKALFDMSCIYDVDDYAKYFIYKFFYENKYNEYVSKYISKEMISGLAEMEFTHKNIKDFIKISKENNLDNNYKEFDKLMRNLNVVIKSNTCPATLMYYSRKYFNNICLVTNKKNVNHDFKDAKFIENEHDVDYENNRTLIINSERPIYADEFFDMFMTFLYSNDKIGEYYG